MNLLTFYTNIFVENSAIFEYTKFANKKLPINYYSNLAKVQNESWGAIRSE